MLFEWLNNLIARRDGSKVDAIGRAVERVIQMPGTDSVGRAQAVEKCLALMEVEASRIRSRVDASQRSGMGGDMWVDGVRLAGQAEALARFLADKDCLPEQARATNVWAKATLAVCGHYRHLVGPAMIAVASISERMGDEKRATAAYTAVLLDFVCVLDGVEDDAFKPGVDDEVALRCLETACRRLVDLGALPGPSADAPAVLLKIQSVWDKPEMPDYDRRAPRAG